MRPPLPGMHPDVSTLLLQLAATLAEFGPPWPDLRTSIDSTIIALARRLKQHGPNHGEAVVALL